jgi:ParB-like chromosome segregation protein Spo0J
VKSLHSILASAYVIKNEKVNLHIAIVDIDALLLHEETIPELLQQLLASIKKDGCLNHPIIVDSESLLVLDGVHRVSALRNLKCKRIPACLVDYEDPTIQILSWYRTIKGTNATKQLLTQIKYVGSNLEKVDQINKNAIGVSPIVAAIKTLDESFLVRSRFEGLKEAYDIIECTEKRLKTIGLEIKYETESDALQRLIQHQADAVLLTPKLTKQAIIDTAHSGKIFAQKASRHIIPARPMRLCVPLNLLRSNRSLSEINEELKSMLQKKRLKQIPSGSVFEGRRYEEDLYVFEEL